MRFCSLVYLLRTSCSPAASRHRKGRLNVLILGVGILLLVPTSDSFGGTWLQNVIKTVDKAQKDSRTAAEKAAEDTANAAKKAADDTANAAKKAADDSANAAKKAADDSANAAKKAAEDSANAAKKAADDSANAAKKAAEDSANVARKAADDTAEATKKAAADIADNAKKAINDLGNTAKKAGRDTANEIVRSPENLERNGLALVNFAVREAEGTAAMLSAAERRIRQGKVVDALWHLGTDPLRNAEQNAATLTQESAFVRAIGQVAATAYGGPGGAAAYASWYTYRATGDPELALRVGIITGVASEAFQGAEQMPSDTVSELTRKVVVTGAIGGIVVGASGGDEAAVREGFLLAGGMVLVQDSYLNTTEHPLDARSSEGEAYCMSSVGEDCSPPDAAYVRDQSGKLMTDSSGRPLVDVRKTDPMKPHVGTWAAKGKGGLTSETGPVLTAVSRVPGMNAMAFLHDQWAVSWDMSALTSVSTITPAIILTYIGTGTPTYDLIQKTNIEADKDRSLKANQE